MGPARPAALFCSFRAPLEASIGSRRVVTRGAAHAGDVRGRPRGRDGFRPRGFPYVPRPAIPFRASSPTTRRSDRLRIHPSYISLRFPSPLAPRPSSVNAPVSKLTTCGAAFASLFAQALHARASLALTPRGLRRGEAWRFLTHNAVFATPGEALFGVYLLYHFRVFERQRGSRRYGVFVTSVLALATAAQAALIPLARALGHRWAREPFASGPHALVWAHLVPYHLDVPSTHHFVVFGVRMSDKVFVYLAAAQLAMSRGTSAWIPSACGLLASAAFHAGLFGLRRWDPPRWIVGFARQTLGRLLDAGGGARRGPIVRTAPARDGGDGFGRGPARGPVRDRDRFGGGGFGGALGGGPGGFHEPPSGPASAEAVETLRSMGFDEGEARRALAMGNNNLEVATNILLEGR